MPKSSNVLALTVILTSMVALLPAATPRPVLAQDPAVTFQSGIRSGAEIQVDQLGELLVQNTMIGETEKNLAGRIGRLEAAPREWPVSLQMTLVSREGIVSRFTSETAGLEVGKTYPTRRWISDARALTSRLVAPLKPAEFVIFRIGQWTVTDPDQRRVPRECREATHAVLISLVSTDRRFSGASGTGKTMALCLEAGDR